MVPAPRLLLAAAWVGIVTRFYVASSIPSSGNICVQSCVRRSGAAANTMHLRYSWGQESGILKDHGVIINAGIQNARELAVAYAHHNFQKSSGCRELTSIHSVSAMVGKSIRQQIEI